MLEVFGGGTWGRRKFIPSSRSVYTVVGSPRGKGGQSTFRRSRKVSGETRRGNFYGDSFKLDLS